MPCIKILIKTFAGIEQLYLNPQCHGLQIAHLLLGGFKVKSKATVGLTDQNMLG